LWHVSGLFGKRVWSARHVPSFFRVDSTAYVWDNGVDGVVLEILNTKCWLGIAWTVYSY
jgi:hypothetical protein